MKRLICVLAACGSGDPAPAVDAAPPAGAKLVARAFPANAPAVHQNETVIYQVNVTNLGDADSGSISLDTPFTVLDPWGCGSLAPGAMCELEVVTIPTVVGDFHETIGVDAAHATRVEVALTATVSAVAPLSIDPGALHFGATAIAIEDVPLFAGLGGELSVRNNGDAPVGQVSVAIAGAPAFSAYVDDCGAVLPAHASCALHVTYYPTQTPPLGGGVDTATLTATVGGQTLTTDIDGFGASLTLDPSIPENQLQLPDAYAGEPGGARTFTVKNTSNDPIGPLAVKVVHTDATPATEIEVAADTCTGATLAPFHTCTLDVGLAMVAPGMAVGLLQVTAPSATAQVNATGSTLYGFATAR